MKFLQNSLRSRAAGPSCVWFTGLSGAGKTTLAHALRDALSASERVFIIDGDLLREGLSRDLGYSIEDREENVRRAAELARLLFQAETTVIVALMSPFRRGRDFARSLFPEDRFFEIYLETSLSECEKRDPKGLYAKARRGELQNITGADAPYEPPTRPDLCLNTAAFSVDDCLAQIMRLFDHEQIRNRA